ncbi:g5332 [Coccomyxa elongata]
MVNNRLVPMHPLKGIDAIGNVMRRGLCLDVRPLSCMSCQSEDFERPEATTESLTLIMYGRHDFNKGRCACKNCGIEHKQGLADFVRTGFWPASPDGEKFETIIDQRVFEHFAALKDRALHISTKV